MTGWTEYGAMAAILGGLAIWNFVTGEEEPVMVPIAEVESLQKQIDSIEAGQLGTYDYLIQQAKETDIQFERLSIEVEKTRGMVLGVTK